MIQLIRPKALQRGDTVACIAPSWGGPGTVQHRYLTGKKQFEQTFGVQVIEAPHALKSGDWVYENPGARLDDIMWAFKNPDVKAIVCAIGGSDSIRLIDYIRPEHYQIIRDHPKWLMGMSDNTVVHFICLKAGIASLYGPTFMYGLAENGGIDPLTIDALQRTMFSDEAFGVLQTSKHGWTLDRVPWEPEFANFKRKMQPTIPWHFVGSQTIARGHLMGGCIDVMDMINGTSIWPDQALWDGAILFLESSEEKPSPDLVMYWLRNYGAQGKLKNIKGLIFGRPGGEIIYDAPDYDQQLKTHVGQFDRFDQTILKALKEFGKDDIPVVTHVDIGHTCPMNVLPYGHMMTIDPIKRQLTID